MDWLYFVMIASALAIVLIVDSFRNDAMRQWLSRAFAFAAGACLVWALLVVVGLATIWLGDGTLLCEGADETCGGPGSAFLERIEPITDIVSWVACLGGGTLFAALSWNRCWKLLLPPESV